MKNAGNEIAEIIAALQSRADRLGRTLWPFWERLSLRWPPVVLAGVIFFIMAARDQISAGWAVAAGALVAVAAALFTGGALRQALGARDGASLHDNGRRAGLSKQAKSWRSLIDAMPDAAVALNAGGTVVHHNERALELFPNIRRGQMIAQVSRNPDLLAAVDKAVNTSGALVVDLHEWVPVERHISSTVTRLEHVDRSSKSPALLVTFRDLSEQDKLDKMRADFIANASHELRTPLASLRGYVETLQGPASNDPDARDRFLAIMASQAARMTRLIDDLLSLSRAEMRVHLPARGKVDVNEAVNYVMQTMEPLAEGADINLEVKNLQAPAFIRGARDEIVQVLQNLIQNAIKYGRDGGHVTVEVFRKERGPLGPARIGVNVIDDGYGIAPDDLPRLTERFYRANVAASRERGGTGLGLAICKHIVLRHQGELKYDSELGKGSKFTVLFDELGTPDAR